MSWLKIDSTSNTKVNLKSWTIQNSLRIKYKSSNKLPAKFSKIRISLVSSSAKILILAIQGCLSTDSSQRVTIRLGSRVCRVTVLVKSRISLNKSSSRLLLSLTNKIKKPQFLRGMIAFSNLSRNKSIKRRWRVKFRTMKMTIIWGKK